MATRYGLTGTVAATTAAIVAVLVAMSGSERAQSLGLTQHGALITAQDAGAADAVATVAVSPGTAGQVLTVSDAGLPHWAAASGGGGDDEADTPQLDDATGWTVTPLLAGSGAIASGAFTATIPVGTTSGTGAYVTRAWPFASAISWEIQGRVQITGDTAGELLAGLRVAWVGASSGDFAVYFRGNGSFFLYREGSWGFASVGIYGSSLPVGGTLWVRMRGEATSLRVYYGVGVGTTPPTTWTTASDSLQPILFGYGPPSTFALLGFSNDGHSVPSGTTVVWRDLRVRSFSP